MLRFLMLSIACGVLAPFVSAQETALPLPAEPKHGRPFLMLEAERQRIRALIAREEWAKQEYEQLTKKAGGGDDILLGREGNDKLVGDKGLDMLFGGLGKDYLKSGKGDDILIGARVTLDSDRLEDAREIWTNGESYKSRVTDVTALLLSNETIIDDGSKDTLKGDKGLDLYFADLGGSDKDKVKGRKSYEELFTLL